MHIFFLTDEIDRGYIHLLGDDFGGPDHAGVSSGSSPVLSRNAAANSGSSPVLSSDGANKGKSCNTSELHVCG